MSEEATNFLARLKSDSEGAYSALYEYDENKGNYADVPILENIPIPEFAGLLIFDSKPNDRLLASLSTRYDYDRHTGALKNEHGGVGRLHKELLDRIAKEKPPFKKILENTGEVQFR